MDSDLLAKDELYEIRKKKIQDEIQSAKRIFSKNSEPLKIADGFIHDTFLLFKEGILKSNPELTEELLNKKVREILTHNKKIRFSYRKKGGIFFG